MFDVSATIVWRSGLAGQTEESKPECAHLTSFWCWLRQEGCEIASHALFVTSLDRFAMLLFDRILIMLCDCAPDEPQSFHTDSTYVSLSARESPRCRKRCVKGAGCFHRLSSERRPTTDQKYCRHVWDQRQLEVPASGDFSKDKAMF